MKYPPLSLFLALSLASPWAATAGGLTAPPAAQVWPGWHARITVQATAVSPVAVSSPLGVAESPRGLGGAALLGDYYIATPSWGVFRATSGLVMGSISGVPLGLAGSGPRLGVSVYQQSSQVPLWSSPESPVTQPYLGLGFSSTNLFGGIQFNADLGLVADNRGASVGRALLGSQGWESAVRELRVTPMLQLGLRYTF